MSLLLDQFWHLGQIIMDVKSFYNEKKKKI